MDFTKKMKLRLYTAISYIVIGAVLIAADCLNGLENQFFFAFGFALLKMGAFRIIHYPKITKHSQSMRKQELAENDERFRMISERAKSWVFSITVIEAGILVIVLSLLGYQEQSLPFAWFVCGMVVLYWIFWSIIRRKY